MKIIILGAGQVGGTLAEHLASEANDITVVDTDAERLRNLGDRLDIRTVQGRASFPTVLRQAGADDADMLVAVTNSDETNMVACQVAHTLFHTPTKIARVREAAYLTRAGLFDNDAIPVDVLISPEQVVTHCPAFHWRQAQIPVGGVAQFQAVTSLGRGSAAATLR